MSNEWHRQVVRLASGATRSADINITGYGCGSVMLPAALKGVVRWRGRQADTGTAGRIYDETATAIIQTTHTWTKPLIMAIHPKVIANARIVNLCVSSAPSGPKDIDVFLKF